MEEEKTVETEIDLLQLINLVLRKWWLIALVTMATLILTIVYSFGFVDDVYTAESSMIVQVVNEDQNDYTNLMYGQRLVDTYQEIARSNTVLDKLRTELGLEMTNGQLRGIITVAGVQNTAILRLRVDHGNPILARNIVNQLVVILTDMTNDFEGLENIEVIDVAETPLYPSGPNRTLYMAIGFILGGMIGVAIVLGAEFLDKKLRYPSDIEEKLGLRLLGTVPHYDVEEGDEN